MAYGKNWQTTTYSISQGPLGTLQTLEAMRQLALMDSQSPQIQSLARSIFSPIALDDWLRQIWIPAPDPPGIEFIVAPERRLAFNHFSGDCDDAATLAAALLVAMNWSADLVAIRIHGQPEYSHVFARTYLDDFPFDIDPIVAKPYLPHAGHEEMTVTVWR